MSTSLAFLLAAHRGDLAEVVRLHAEEGADPRDEGNWAYGSPLVAAVREGHRDVVEYLVEHGADPHEDDARGESAMHVAVECDMVWMAELLVRRGADVNHDDGFPYLHVAATRQMTLFLLRCGADVDARSSDGMSALMSAVNAANAATAALLLDRGASIDMRDDEENTPLMYCVGNRPMLELLISRGADVNARCGSGGKTALVQAAQVGCAVSVAVLVAAGARVDVADTDGWTPLMYAAKTGCLASAVVLVQAGATITGTELCVAMRHGHHEVAEMLIARGACCDQLVANGRELLLLSVRKSRPLAVRLLLRLGVRPIDAIERASGECLDELVAFGAASLHAHPLQVASTAIEAEMPNHLDAHVPHVVRLACSFIRRVD